jgi:hypothetical protein
MAGFAFVAKPRPSKEKRQPVITIGVIARRGGYLLKGQPAAGASRASVSYRSYDLQAIGAGAGPITQ